MNEDPGSGDGEISTVVPGDDELTFIPEEPEAEAEEPAAAIPEEPAVEPETETEEPEAVIIPEEEDDSAASVTPTSLELSSTIVENRKYVYNGISLTQEVITTTVDNGTPTTETLYYAYDASGSPMTVTYSNATCYYVTNLQSDVIAILNTSGTALLPTRMTPGATF